MVEIDRMNAEEIVERCVQVLKDAYRYSEIKGDRPEDLPRIIERLMEEVRGWIMIARKG